MSLGLKVGGAMERQVEADNTLARCVDGRDDFYVCGDGRIGDLRGKGVACGQNCEEEVRRVNILGTSDACEAEEERQ